MKEIIFDIIQFFIVSIILIFYLLTYPPTKSECDINGDIVYSLKAYILFSISTFFCVSISKLIIWYYFRNKIVLHVINITISYILIIFVIIGGIFVAQQMNINKDCSNFFMHNKNIFSIFISIVFLALVNIIYGCIQCKNDYNIIYDGYTPLIYNM